MAEPSRPDQEEKLSVRVSSEEHLYNYSDDDSGSLSDAYFFPSARSDDPVSLAYSPENAQTPLHKLWKPPENYREEDPLQNAIPSSSGALYGATSTAAAAAANNASPLTINEDIEFDPAALYLHGAANNHQIPQQMLRNQARLQIHGRHISAPEERYRMMRQRQLEQFQRERAVKEIRGTPQDTSKCRDVAFAIVFLAQLVAIFYAAVRFGSTVVLFDKSWMPWSRLTQLESHGSFHGMLAHVEMADDDMLFSELYGKEKISDTQLKTTVSKTSLFTIDYQTVISLCAVSGLYACLLTMFTVGFMLIIAKSLIQVSLVFSILLALAWVVIGYALEPHGLVPIMGCLALFLLVAYTMVVWDRISFAATNLHTALCAMRSTAGITLLGIGMLFVSFAWCLVWSVAFIGIVDTINECKPGDLYCQESLPHSHIFLYAVLVFSFIWTNLVIKNIVRATVASAVAAWWFRPNEVSPCCPPAVGKPLLRLVTTSLGSISLGSLVVLPSQIIRAITWLCCLSIFRSPKANNNNNKNNNNRLDSAAQCWGGLVRVVRRYFLRCNRWSFCYIGMYGYSFAEAGDKAIQLFETREWMSVVGDNLIHNVLLLASIVIGGSTGTFGVVVEELDGVTFTSFHKPIITAFVLSSVLGFFLSNIVLLGVVGSAVNTILVCFAAGPFEFHRNHPRLSQEMRDVWSQQVFEPTV